LTAGYPGLLAPHMMHGVPPELMAAGVLGPGLLPYARPQLVSTTTTTSGQSVVTASHWPLPD